MTVFLPELQYLTDDPACTDYRPAVGPAGASVVFERTPRGGDTVLYRIDDFDAPDPVPFLTGAGAPLQQTRPDWCWPSRRIAFNGLQDGPAGLHVWIARDDGTGAAPLRNTLGFAYPTWNSDGSRLTAENSGPHAPLRPSNPVFSADGIILAHDIDGFDGAGNRVFGGMPAARPECWPQIAFAGQPAIIGWGGSDAPGPSYNQATNYIFLNTAGDGGFTSEPMEAGASISSYDPRHQGRAPAWSPDGRTIAFESDRSGGGYAVYLCDLASGAVTQVTDPALGAQHPKFFPCGTKLILSALHPDRQPTTTGIAWVDISGLLQG